MITISEARNAIQIECCGRTWLLERTADMEQLWAEMSDDTFKDDERLPYWADVWPGGVLIGRWIFRNSQSISGHVCLDLGCGLGLTSVMAAFCGARVVAVDYEWEAVYSSRKNMGLNNVLFLPVQMDWRFPCLKQKSVQFIFGGDILYEKRFTGPLIELFNRILDPEGRIIIAEPERSTTRHALDTLKRSGFSVTQEQADTIPWKDYEVNIFLRVLTRSR